MSKYVLVDSFLVKIGGCLLIALFFYLPCQGNISSNQIDNKVIKGDLLFFETDSVDRPEFIILADRRYKKGIELIRLLYEKVLGLDYHFSSMESLQGLSELSNLNAYPMFKELIQGLDGDTKKKLDQMPDEWLRNPYTMNALLQPRLTHLKSNKRDQLGCMLDFASRIHADINMIYYETQYLRMSNEELKKTCVKLFEEYTDIIGYDMPLEECRKNDDWENLFVKLDAYIQKLEDKYHGTSEQREEARRMHSDIIFPVNLIMDFINRYTIFVADGTRHYQKFGLILKNYERQSICAEDLPAKFSILQKEVDDSVSKFNEAYYIAELRGSKLKDLLFGRG